MQPKNHIDLNAIRHNSMSDIFPATIDASDPSNYSKPKPPNTVPPTLTKYRAKPKPSNYPPDVHHKNTGIDD